MGRNIAFSYVPDRGWTGRGFSLEHAPAAADEIRLTLSPRGREPVEVPVTRVEAAEGRLEIVTADFDYRAGWKLTVAGDSYTRREMDEERCEGLEHFAPGKAGDVLYRLYSPKAASPRPMILFLHGGGNGGTDNITQIAADFSCNHFVKTYPDFFILAPQAREPDLQMMVGRIGKMTFAESGQDGDLGWSRRYLGEVCDLIRGMIADGRVDGRRVYVAGMSMGGAGTLRAMSVGADLFAAAVPVCPTMTPETFAILKGLVHAKLWIATSYVDHTVYRHKYIVDGILALRDAGNRDARLTLYSPEELQKYGIAADPDLSYPELFSQNHMSWVPTYHDEHGIMSWLTEQVRD